MRFPVFSGSSPCPRGYTKEIGGAFDEGLAGVIGCPDRTASGNMQGRVCDMHVAPADGRREVVIADGR